MTIIDILHFPGHVFVDHMLASLFFYAIGLYPETMSGGRSCAIWSLWAITCF